MNSRIGRTRYKLAAIVSKATGALFEAHNFTRNHPMHQHYEDCCAWDAWGVLTTEHGPVKIHVYSWDQMGRCVKHGITLIKHSTDHNDFEVSANE